MLPHYQRIESKLISLEWKAFVVSTKSVALVSILKIPFLVPQGIQIDLFAVIQVRTAALSFQRLPWTREYAHSIHRPGRRTRDALCCEDLLVAASRGNLSPYHSSRSYKFTSPFVPNSLPGLHDSFVNYIFAPDSPAPRTQPWLSFILEILLCFVQGRTQEPDPLSHRSHLGFGFFVVN